MDQEGVGSITSGRHVSNRLKIIYLESLRRKLSIDIYVSQIQEGGWVGWSHDVVLIFRGGSNFFLGHFHIYLNISSKSSVQAQSIATLVEQIV